MALDHEYGYKVRILKIFRSLLERPSGLTKKELAKQNHVHEDTIANDFKAFVTAGFEMDKDEKWRWFFVVDKPLKRASSLLYFSEEERFLLHTAIDNLQTTADKQQRLKQKLHALYDYSRLGFAFLRKPHLNKVDCLEDAKARKKRVLLEGYRSSNSNSVSDRIVEPYHINPSEDTLQTFDVEKKIPRHFRISRISRVRILEESDWEYEQQHHVQITDPFRIVDNNQVNVHLRLSVGAYNELVERYPTTRSYIEPTADENFFDFQCNVNHKFYGLSNFILGFYHLEIEVLQPDSLREHLRAEVERMKF